MKGYPKTLKYTSSKLLSFLHCWDYCWKCEFDTDVKIENDYHYDREQPEQLSFLKKVHVKTQSQKNDVLVIFVLQETKNFNLFDKNCTQDNVKCYIQHEESWHRWTVIEQVNHK